MKNGGLKKIKGSFEINLPLPQQAEIELDSCLCRCLHRFTDCLDLQFTLNNQLLAHE